MIRKKLGRPQPPVKRSFELTSFAAAQFKIELQKHYAEYDANGDQSVSFVELRDARKKARAEAGDMSRESIDDMAQRIVFYERLFFKVDHACTGWLPQSRVAELLPFFQMTLDYASALAYMKSADDDDDGGLTRFEFVALMTDMYMATEAAPSNALQTLCLLLCDCR